MIRQNRKNIKRNTGILIALLIIILVIVGLLYFLEDEEIAQGKDGLRDADAPIPEEQIGDEFRDGIHVETGLVEGEGLRLVIGHCTACHSAKLITQNAADRDGWEKMIRWMQETQNLWDLGAQEDIILDYLAENYAPKKRGRRPPLGEIEWYELKN